MAIFHLVGFVSSNLWGKFSSGKRMPETELDNSRVFSPFCEESCDEELTVLPRHTKVIVKGNNRTKSVLVGLQGVVKKAVGLGGWYWLVHYIYTCSSFILFLILRPFFVSTLLFFNPYTLRRLDRIL